MAIFEGFTSWLSGMIGQALAKITGFIDEARGIAELSVPNLDLEEFTDAFRGEQREEQFTAMIDNPDIAQEIKDTEFIELDRTLPRNYLVHLEVEFTDEATGEVETGLRSMYVDERLSNTELENVFIEKWQQGSGKTEMGFTSVAFSSIGHSKGSPYGNL